PALLQRVAAAAEGQNLSRAQQGMLCYLLARDAAFPDEDADLLRAELDWLERITDANAFVHPRLTVGAPTCQDPAQLLATLRHFARYAELYKSIGASMR